MNPHPSISLLCATGVLAASASNLTAGFGVGRVSEQRTPINMTALETVDFSKARRSFSDVLQAIPAVQLSPEARAATQRIPQFSGLDAAGVDAQFAGYHFLLANSIATIARSEDDLGNTLAGTYLNGRISLSLAVNFYTDVDIRFDGHPRVGDEAININWLPPRLTDGAMGYPLYTPDGFRFMNSLAREGGHALQQGYGGPPPQTPDQKAEFAWHLYNQNVGTGMAEVARIRGTMDVMDGILNNDAIPAGITGIPADIGSRLLDNSNLTRPEILSRAGELKAYLGATLPLAEADLAYDELGKAATALFLDDKFPAVNSAFELTKRTSNWGASWHQMSGPYSYVGIGGGGGRIDETDPDNPFVVGYNKVWQVGGQPDGTIVEQEFTIPEVDYLPAGFYEGNRLLVVGWSVSDGLSYGFGYRDTDNDGFVEEDTRETVFTTPMFSHGLQLLRNEGRDELVGFDLATRGIYRLDSPNQNGFPTTFTHQGGLGTDRLEINKVGFNERGDWAYGLTLGYRYAWQPYNFGVEARYSETEEQFDFARLSYRHDEVEMNPAVAEALFPGNIIVRGTGTPNTEYTGYKWESNAWKSIGSVQADPLGRYFFESSEAFQIGGHYRFGNEARDEWSPTYQVPDVNGGPLLQDPKFYEGDYKFNYFYIPGTDMAIDRRSSLGAEWEPGLARTILSFGFGNAKILSAVLGTEGFFRARIVSKGPVVQPEYVLVAPTAIFSLFPAWNSHFAYNNTQFSLPQGQFDAQFLSTPGMGSLTSRLFAIANPFGNGYSLEYRLQMEQFAALLNAFYVLPDYGKVLRPVVEYNEFGQEVVYVNCLVINEEFYPVVQFAIRPPDNCLFFHWHSPYFARVFHLDNDTTGITDPDQPFCGYGTIFELIPERVEVPYHLWLDFLDIEANDANLPTF